MRTFVCVRPTDSGNLVTIAVRSPDPDGKAFLAQTISEVDWLPLFIHSFIHSYATYFTKLHIFCCIFYVKKCRIF